MPRFAPLFLSALLAAAAALAPVAVRAEGCGDATCDGGESYESCPQDCPETCGYQFAYAVTVTCGGVETDFEGAISATYTLPCPEEGGASSAAQVAVAQNLVATGDLCGLRIGDGANVGGFYFDLTFRDVCRNLPGSQEELPGGYVQTQGGACCADGDADSDGLCDGDDPCDNVSDADIGSVEARAAAGLGVDLASPADCHCVNGGDYNAAANLCEGEDLCSNFEGRQDQAWLDARAELARDGDGSCRCATFGERLCPELEPACVPETSCCNGDDFYYCADAGDCLANPEPCGEALACRDGWEYCAGVGGGSCVPAGQCVYGCFAEADPAGEYCTEIVGSDGAMRDPWATQFSGDEAAAANLFEARNEPGAQTLAEARAAQSAAIAARAASTGAAAVPVYPIYGRVPVADDGGQCRAEVCDYGQECALFVRSDGETSAVCADTKCDPCDASLPPVPEGGRIPGECYYDPEAVGGECPCDPATDPLTCCRFDESVFGAGNVDECLLAPRGLSIEVAPNLIDAGGSCFVLWAARGMASTTLVGDGVPNWASHGRAGVVEIENVSASTIFKILGEGIDGAEYQATALCATNPYVDEV